MMRKFGNGLNQRLEEDDFNDLIIVGYSATVFPTDGDRSSEAVRLGQHLIPWNGDESLKIDRYDCRSHLNNLSIHEPVASRSGGILKKKLNDCGLSEEERVEEELCDEERYQDLKIAIEEEELEEERKRSEKRGAEFSLNYDELATPQGEEVVDEEEVQRNDVPYVPRPELKIPTGMDIPETQRMNTIIEKTADFVAKQGPQMEIIIKAKQKNSNRLDFMNWDDKLNTYYRHVLKMIKERGYEVTVTEPETTNIAESEMETNEDSDEGDHYLHPLLTSGLGNLPDSNESDPRDSGTQTNPEPTSYKLGEEDDVYSALFNQLSAVMPKREETYPEATVTADSEEGQPPYEENSRSVDMENLDCPIPSYGLPSSDYAEWYHWFYGGPPPLPYQSQIIPPPPDMMPVIKKSAEFVCRLGPTAELHLLERQDLQLDFLRLGHPYRAFYETQIWWLQYEAYMRSYQDYTNYQQDSGGHAPAENPAVTPETPKKSQSAMEEKKGKIRIRMPSVLGRSLSQVFQDKLDKPFEPGTTEGQDDSLSSGTATEKRKRKRSGFSRIGSAPLFGSDEPAQAIPPPGLVKIEGQVDGGKERIQICPLPKNIVGQVLSEDPHDESGSPFVGCSVTESQNGSRSLRKGRLKSPDSRMERNPAKKAHSKSPSSPKMKKTRGKRKVRSVMKSPTLLPSTAVIEDNDDESISTRETAKQENIFGRSKPLSTSPFDPRSANDREENIQGTQEIGQYSPRVPGCGRDSSRNVEDETKSALQAERRKRVKEFLLALEKRKVSSGDKLESMESSGGSANQSDATAIEEGEIPDGSKQTTASSSSSDSGSNQREPGEQEKTERNQQEECRRREMRSDVDDFELPSTYARTRRLQSFKVRSSGLTTPNPWKSHERKMYSNDSDPRIFNRG